MLSVMATGDFVIRNIRALRWTGNNGALIAQMCGEIEVDDSTWSVDAELPGQFLRLRQFQSARNNGYWTIQASAPWVLVSNDFPGVWARLSDAAFGSRYTTWNALLAQAIESSVINIPVYSLVMTSGEAALPVLTLVSPNYEVTVPFRTAMPSTSYGITWRALAGAQLLASVSLQPGKTITKTTTSVKIPLRTVGAVTVAGVVTVDVAALVTS